MSVNNYNTGLDFPFSASGDLDAVQYRFVMQATTAGRVLRATGASNPAPLGVLQNDPKSGDTATVRIWGISFLDVNADTAISYGDYLTSSSVGHGVINTNGSSVAAVALQAVTSGSGVRIPVLLLPFASGNKSDNVP